MISRIFIALLLATAWIDGHAQSSLPPCPTDTSVVWTNCHGTFTYPSGAKYVGTFKDDAYNGHGKLISAKGFALAEGMWIDNYTVVSAGTPWRYVSDGGGVIFFVATQSIRQEGVFRRAWVMRGYDEVEPEFRWLSVRSLEKVDCVNERTQRMSSTAHDGPFGSGNVLDTFGEREWQYVAPGTTYAGVAKFICDYKLTPKK